MLRIVVPALVAALLASQGAWAKEVFGTRGADRIVGTASGDLIKPRSGADRVDARGGNDRIVSPADDAGDSITCGAGTDLALVGGGDRVARDCERVARQISRDRSLDPLAQHETAVEPHSFSFGRAIVSAYQLGRFAGGGAGAIGWSTSRDAGATWRSGTLPTAFGAVSDPVVAYDAVHSTWLITFVALTRPRVDVLVSRSPDGLTWSAPLVVAIAPSPDADYDKEWIVCDNGAASAFRGRCYVSYLDTGSTTILTRASTDGGRTWGPAVGSRAGLPDGAFVNGAIPVVRPNGDLLVLETVFAPFGDGAANWVASTRSTDGGATFSAAVRVASLRAEDPVGMRAPPLLSAAVDATGAVRAVWADCRFDEQCRSNDIVIAVSRDGVSWAPPARVPTGVAAASLPTDAMIPAVAVSGTNVAVAYYTLPQPSGCPQLSCRGLDAWLVVQRGGKWAPPQRISPQPMPLAWLADGGIGAMVGDYISVTWSAGTAVAVLTVATEPEGGVLREAVYAAAAAP